jgi:Plant mobile domain
VLDLDTLGVADVRWEPYTLDAVAVRAPMGLASTCFADQALWLTKTPMVFDIFVEVHCADRVMRQFGCAQPFPLDRATERGVSRQEHRYATLPFPVMSI